MEIDSLLEVDIMGAALLLQYLVFGYNINESHARVPTSSIFKISVGGNGNVG